MNCILSVLKDTLLLTLLSFFLIPNILIAQGDTECEDPDYFVLPDDSNPNCGLAFDLCRDYRTLSEDGLVDIFVSANDDLGGQFSPCDLNLVTDAGFTAHHGIVTKENDNGKCFFRYQLQDFNQTEDSFYYYLSYVDPCRIPPVEDYCTGGKIWTINSSFYGSDGSTVIVSNKKGQTVTQFAIIHNLTAGEEFSIDGTDLPTNQTEWVFSFYTDSDAALNGAAPYSSAQVHTSCSAAIFGIDFGVFRPLDGCVGPYKDRKLCVGQGSKEIGANQVRNNVVTFVDAKVSDTTIVVLSLVQVGTLPIEFSGLKGRAQGLHNLIEWSISSVYDEDYMILQSSADGKSFANKGKFSNLAEGSFEFLDRSVENANTYYRFMIVSTNGEKSYSSTISVKNTRLENDDINVFPNPSTNNFTISSEVEIRKVHVIDLNGRRIATIPVNSWQVNINRSDLDLSSGLYLIDIELTNDTTVKKKVTLIN